MLILLVGAGFTLHFVQESSLTLEEGQGLNVSTDYREWELAVWVQEVRGAEIHKKVYAYDVSEISTGKVLSFKGIGLDVEVMEFHTHCDALTKKRPSSPQNIINASGIKSLKEKKANADPANNFPGIVMSVKRNEDDKESGTVLLYGGESGPTQFIHDKECVFASLRRKKHPLPVVLKLIDFKKTEHPGTQMAKSYESRVLVSAPELDREVIISMNKPLRYQQFTFYQSSYSQNQQGESSTLSVVRNSGRLIPYFASLVISVGLIVHFFIMLIKFANRTRKGYV
ncbi:cytochrome c biogenesis protein ResB [Fibrobacterota bacterium]